MEYTLNNKVIDYRILSEILQNRFTKFDDSVVRWTFKGNEINSKELESKIINNYQRKKNKINSLKVIYSDWIEIFDTGLKKLKNFNKQPILFFSGGKDSTFIASRLVQNNIQALYYSFVKNKSEKKILDELAKKLGINIFYTNGQLEYLNLEEILSKIKEPVLDPAGLSVLSLLDISKKNKINFEDSIFLDGMGNDFYMGHLPSKQELRKSFFQRIFFKIHMHELFSTNAQNLFGKFGDLFRPDYAAHFPGSTIKLNDYYDNINFYKKYQIYDDIILRRALQRGIHYDFCSAIAKSIIYVDACSEKSGVFFPFLNDDLIEFYEFREVYDFDYSNLINKLSIRKYLNENLNFDKISSKKGIFQPTYPSYNFSNLQKKLAKKINIRLKYLNKAQKLDFYLWSKYIINNDIGLD
tara:strand:+ start:1794 stop:3026 length:1233 start_codon:yes stop_codon:yes gene_type:complete